MYEISLYHSVSLHCCHELFLSQHFLRLADGVELCCEFEWKIFHPLFHSCWCFCLRSDWFHLLIGIRWKFEILPGWERRRQWNVKYFCQYFFLCAMLYRKHDTAAKAPVWESDVKYSMCECFSHVNRCHTYSQMTTARWKLAKTSWAVDRYVYMCVCMSCHKS